MGTFSRETPNAESIHPWYITGFTEGEGSFTYSRTPTGVGLYFAIRLTNKEKLLLESIRNFFGNIGKIYPVKALAPTTNSGKTKSSWYFRVTRVDDLLKIVDHFDRYPLIGIKKQSYLIWKKMVLVKSNFRNGKGERLNSLAQQLSEASPRNQPWDGTNSK